MFFILKLKICSLKKYDKSIFHSSILGICRLIFLSWTNLDEIEYITFKNSQISKFSPITRTEQNHFNIDNDS